MKHTPLVLITLLTLTLIAAIGLRDSQMPEPIVVADAAPLPSSTATATPAPGWWDDLDFATPTLKKLPGLPDPQFEGGVAGQEAGEPVPFQVISCPGGGVQISGVVTAQPGWWHITGTASIPDLWYWKAELSGDGAAWVGLYRSE